MQLLDLSATLQALLRLHYIFELSLQTLNFKGVFVAESGLIVLTTVGLKVVTFSRAAWFDDTIIASSWKNVICLVQMTLDRLLNCRVEYMYLYMFHYFGEFSLSESSFLPGEVNVKTTADVVVNRVYEHDFDHFLIHFSMIIETRRRRNCICH